MGGNNQNSNILGHWQAPVKMRWKPLSLNRQLLDAWGQAAALLVLAFAQSRNDCPQSDVVSGKEDKDRFTYPRDSQLRIRGAGITSLQRELEAKAGAIFTRVALLAKAELCSYLKLVFGKRIFGLTRPPHLGQVVRAMRQRSNVSLDRAAMDRLPP